MMSSSSREERFNEPLGGVIGGGGATLILRAGTGSGDGKMNGGASFG